VARKPRQVRSGDEIGYVLGSAAQATVDPIGYDRSREGQGLPSAKGWGDWPWPLSSAPKNKEFCRIRPSKPFFFASNQRGSATSSEIPCATEQEINSTEQGIIFKEQEN
jgi:hypothetical protein